jgi:hypothetical protein
MRIRLAIAAVLSVPLFVACNQSVSPTGPTSFPVAGSSLRSADADATGTHVSVDHAAGSSAATEVPFKGSFEGTLTVSPPTEPPFLPSFIAATGNATHLGRFTLEIPHIVNTAIAIGTGTFEFRAANGDMLFADFVGQATMIAPGVLSTVDTATITGGTGRFANATGRFTGNRVFVIGAAPVTGVFEGTISMASGSKP